jgi:NADP-dependent 3-hydroxy acid dehydrogenase YdfG
MVLQHLLPCLGKWTRQSIPDLSGKVAVVSGFNSGLGFETTRTLLEHNAEVGNASKLHS